MPEHIEKIITTYKNRPDKVERYARRVSMSEIEKNDYNLNISRYVSTALSEEKVNLQAVNEELVALEEKIRNATHRHNEFLAELGLPLLPLTDK